MINMKYSCSGVDLLDEARYVHRFMIDDFAVTKDALRDHNQDYCIKSRCSVGGHEWEIRFYPARWYLCYAYSAVLELAFLGGGGTRSHGVWLWATLTARLFESIHPGCNFRPVSATMPVQKVFKAASDSPLLVYVGSGEATDAPPEPPGWLDVECTITVIRDKEEAAVGMAPASDLHRHLGELLRSEAGADVTFTVSGKAFAAHKNILAARSPVFKAEFFGDMEEKTSQRVEIKDMDPDVFEAVLRFIYTDMVPAELENKDAASGTVMAQHLLVAADRYGLDRLKVICEQRLALGIDIKTAASTLALAEKHNCSGLRAKCIEFIAGTSAENLEAVMATEGFRHLEASSPSVLTELLKTANRRKNRSTF